MNRRTRLCRPLHNHSATRPVYSYQECDVLVRRNPCRGLSGFGAGNETRTRDLNLGKVALYQLSYSRVRPTCYRKTRDHTSVFTLQNAAFPLRHSLPEVLPRTAGAGEKQSPFRGPVKLERETRLELATSTLARLRSTN